MSITVTINNGSPTSTITISNVPWTSGMDVQQALEAAYNKFTFYYWIEYFGNPDSGGLGYFIQNFNGLTSFGSKYWILYLNGSATPSALGIDSSILDDGNTIEFKYEEYSQQQHGNTVWSQFHEVMTARK